MRPFAAAALLAVAAPAAQEVRRDEPPGVGGTPPRDRKRSAGFNGAALSGPVRRARPAGTSGPRGNRPRVRKAVPARPWRPEAAAPGAGRSTGGFGRGGAHPPRPRAHRCNPGAVICASRVAPMRLTSPRNSATSRRRADTPRAA